MMIRKRRGAIMESMKLVSVVKRAQASFSLKARVLLILQKMEIGMKEALLPFQTLTKKMDQNMESIMKASH